MPVSNADVGVAERPLPKVAVAITTGIIMIANSHTLASAATALEPFTHTSFFRRSRSLQASGISLFALRTVVSYLLKPVSVQESVRL